MKPFVTLIVKAHAIGRMLLLGLVLFVASSPVFSQQVAKLINTSNGQIGFLQFTPADYGSQKHPLIVFMHGIGERGNGTTQINNVAANGIPHLIAQGATMQFTVGGQTSSFVVLSPQLSTIYGTWPSFYVKEMIKYAKANLQIDTNRIYVTGLSLGGGGSWIYGFESLQNDLAIAALAPVCGTDDGWDANACNSAVASHLPIWTFHCADDGTVPVGNVSHILDFVLNFCNPLPNPAAKRTIYMSGGHSGAWNNAYRTDHPTFTLSDGSSYTQNPNIYEWFLSNKRTPPTANAGVDQTIQLPTTSTVLNGAASTSPAGISTYSWQQVSGPATASISNAGAAAPVVSNLVAGSYQFSLTVTDAIGFTNTDVAKVTVSGTTLPVEFAYIKGQRSGSDNVIQWATATEQNTDYFSIERSEDGSNFNSIGKVNGAGNSSALTTYSFTDATAPKGNAFYRLREIDKDGAAKMSKVIVVNGSAKKVIEQIYPNPVHDNLVVTLDNAVTGKGRIALFDVSGRIMVQENISKDEELYNYVMNTKALTPGLYFVEVKVGDNYRVMQRIVKQ